MPKQLTTDQIVRISEERLAELEAKEVLLEKAEAFIETVRRSRVKASEESSESGRRFNDYTAARTRYAMIGELPLRPTRMYGSGN